MKLPITMFTDEAGWIVVECPALPGCISQGRTRAEAVANIKDAIAGWLQVERESGGSGVSFPLQIEVTEVEVAA
jgi:predicted RNase H-like HicB family nuclease